MPCTQIMFDCAMFQMCCLIPVREKMQPAPGFPRGWNYVIQEPKEGDGTTVLAGLFLYSPTGCLYRSVSAAKRRNSNVLKDFPRVSRDFYRHVGVTDPPVMTRSLRSAGSGPVKCIDVGTSVYCSWPNGQWYPSTITKKTNNGGVCMFSVSKHARGTTLFSKELVADTLSFALLLG